MDQSDPISDSTPNKRRKLNDGKAWDSQDDSGDDLSESDFNTVATLRLETPQLQYTKDQFHADLRPSQAAADNQTYITQPTQAINLNTSTQSRTLGSSLPNTSDVLVEQSSPAPSPQAKAPPPPVRRALAPNARGGLLASAMAPPGTSFRAPPGIQSRPKPITIDVDSDEDPPVHHSSDEEEARVPTNTLKPTIFKRRERETTPNRADKIVHETPRAPSVFASLMSDFAYSSPPVKIADDLVSSYSNASRRPRPQLASRPSASSAATQPKPNMYKELTDIDDFGLRRKVESIRKAWPDESIQRCMEALEKCHRNVDDACAWLLEEGEKDAPGETVDEADELSSTSPVVRRGIAVASSRNVPAPSQPIRSAAKQEVKAPSLTIAEKYGAGRSQSQGSKVPQSPIIIEDDDAVKPARKRLQQGRKTPRSPSPASDAAPQKPPQPLQRSKQQQQRHHIIINDDSDSDSGGIEIQNEEQASASDRRLLKFLNECTVEDLVDLSAQPADSVKLVLDQRPFATLDIVRTITVTEDNTTKSGKRSKKTKAVGDRIVDVCAEMLTGYDAVDELVEECDRIAKPIKDALKAWGVGATSGEGELQMMKLDEAHDSGIGTPSSSCHGDDGAPGSITPKSKRNFLAQPPSMNAEMTLKDFQLVGLNWLSLLWSKKVSCILADDMGLGKTCQVIAFLAHLQDQHVEGVHLVVVPGSTLENWLREFARFAPKLKVVPYYGSQGEREGLRYDIEQEQDSIDVIVTTYDMAQKDRDNKFLRRLQPVVCIYDEAHALRNTQSDRYRQLTRIQASFRVLLTGTPLQNNLQELVAILAFIMPELFQEKREELQYIFQHKATTKDTDHAVLLSNERIARARTMITPFILRRKKQQVLELPAKHSRVDYCDMTKTQVNYYAELLQQFQEQYHEKKTARQSSNMLMSLRKAAIHPLLSRRLYDDKKIDKMVARLVKHDEFSQNDPQKVKDFLTGEHYQSPKGGDYALHRFCAERPYMKEFMLKGKPWLDAGKVKAFQKLVREYVENGDRVLVFSQFTTMMNILEAVLDDMDTKFCRLDGSTSIQVRQALIDTFYEDDSIKVFMLSTKAGGAGINLACANRVIIFDSGFNPQDDIQAENRAHRVGQTREVEIVRLVTRGTVEEQIHALGESKLALDERVAGEGVEEKQAEKMGEQIVERMLLDSLKEEEGEEETKDLKDMFKSGLESAGVRVASKQARF
ncbi:SNF2 family N-terminal domain-containing protein [Neohortaea acidophila]|uniref:DNA helicase n=1 Tax=Neohortaea acidophila TaxID=245834 RepID=A0A6A6PR56_9PEZI|nr:SNF2 family N-terminal domain-containing protein [Neohortaea acidophila]KAF2482590.1 SNF2 family N-terminal domain-containing protein [Neohortaea acidophila]